ncbi:MAG: hypothetical protein HY873_09560 [Chloroflexi bacterium]|nr:hypothetical protein [Chloroflexota bacterium]
MLVMPRWWLLLTSPDDGVRVQVNAWGASGIGLDEALYGALERDAYDGEIPIRDPFLVDARGAPQTGSFWNIAIGGLARVVGGTAEALAVATAVAAVAAFLLYYALAWRLTGSRLMAMSAMGLSLALLHVVHRSPGFLALRHWSVLEPLLKLDAQHEVHIWTRYLAPAMPLPLFFGMVLALPAAVLGGRRVPVAVAGLLLAVLVYTYLFYWLSLVLALSAWAVWLARSGDRTAALRLVAVLAIGLALASPELALLAHNGQTLPDDVQARVGAYGGFGLHTDWIRAILQRVVLGVPFAWLALKGPRINRLYVALYAAPLVPASTTDWLPQTDHFLFQAWPVFSIPLFIAGSVEGTKRLGDGPRRAAAGAVVVAGVLGFAHFGAVQVRGLQAIDATYAMPEDEQAAFAWIEENLSPDDTVVTPSWITNQLLAAMTPASTYLADGFVTRVSNEELADRYLRVSAAYGIDEETAFYRIDPVRDVPTSDKSIPDAELERYFDSSMAYYLFNEGIRRPRDLTDRTPAWREKFRSFKSDSGVLGGHDGDYLFCGHRERFWEDGTPSAGTWVEEAFKRGDAVVYRIVAEGTVGAREFDGCGTGTVN